MKVASYWQRGAARGWLELALVLGVLAVGMLGSSARAQDPMACPATGCPGGGDEDVCTPEGCILESGPHAGCRGTRYCDAQGNLGACTLTSTSTRSCQACGTGGRQACYADGSFGTCQPATATAEVCNGCDDDKDGCVDDPPEAGGGSGSLVASTGETASAGTVCAQWIMSRSCGSGTCSGASYCQGGQWSACSTANTQRTCTTGCGTSGTLTCNASSEDSKCIASEVCNNCDDDGNNVIDNAPHSNQANTLTRAYANPHGCQVNGQEQCTNGTWGGPTGCGGASSQTCTSSVPGCAGKLACTNSCQVAATCTSPQDLLWCGDFRTGDFTQYRSLQCGARVASDGSSGAGSCPGGIQSNGFNTVAGQVTCPNPDDAQCRFALVTPPAPAAGASSTFVPTGSAMRVRVAPSRDPANPDLGDSASFINFPWGRDHRNELATTRESTSTGTPGQYGQNDDRYYGWSTFIPADTDTAGGTLPDPGTDPSANWKILLQFHSVGSCDSGGPNLSIGLKRTDTPTSVEKGPKYQWAMLKRDRYWDNNADPSTADGQYSPSKALGWNGTYRLWPFNTSSNSYPNTSLSVEKGRWYTFVLRVRWSACDCPVNQPCAAGAIACLPGQEPGIVELWVDGQPVYPITSGTNPDPTFRPTLYRWPQESEYQVGGPLHGSCPNRSGESSQYQAGTPMPAYLKTGLYRHKLTGWLDTVYQADLVVGTNRAAVDPRTRPR